ncbi:NADH-quinone oxidoreductase subunit NuoG [Paraflavisolibacter sp. H34]|uniref:NADH-quinone oxidoreductase subunit NuoG n=1 Tax=Huijunlia imazamoxiresistens TaxID=3127457 RepID=UPI00301717F6
MPSIIIDNKAYEVKAGKNLLEACLASGFDLPYFCWHPALGSVGACRQCAVKVFKDEADTRGRLVMSCMEEVKDGLRLSVHDPFARQFREQVIEWLMTNHPHDCPVCDEGGACHLQDMTVMTGHDYRRYRFTKRTYRNQYLGPLIHHEMNRCIQCYRCVRFYHDYAGGKDLNVFAAHNHVYFGREQDGVLESPFSGNLAEVCPTGVFTDKTLKEHFTRKWDLTMAPSVCHHCSVGCNTIAGERYGQLRCVVNRFHPEVNGYFLCDRGRFGYEFVNSENRITRPLVRQQRGEAVTEAELTDQLQTVLAHSRLIGIGSPRASVETNFALWELAGAGNFYGAVSSREAALTGLVTDILEWGGSPAVSLKEIEEADAVLVLGEDVWNTAPMMALAIRRSVQKTAAAGAAQEVRLPLWYDAAIKELVQQNKGFLAQLTVAASPLDENATTIAHAAPDDLARLGFAIAAALDPSLPAVPEADAELAATAQQIADALRQAQKPVVVSGLSCGSENVIRAAAAVAGALRKEGKQAGLAVALPECNSLGLALMKAPSFEEALRRLEGESGCTVVIAEADLYRSVPAALADQFFQKCGQVIVLDSLHSPTTEQARILLPAATFAEADGTLVNYEGRAQRFYQVFVPANPLIRESWRWLAKMKLLKTQTANGQELNPDKLLAKLEAALPVFAGISQAAPPHDFSIHGERIPREPHRYSGRTAMLANRNVSEPKPLQDHDSPLTFTMEGFRGIPPVPEVPFFWSPGWNSVQAVAKYQEDPGGPLRAGTPGFRLLHGKEVKGFFPEVAVPNAFKPEKDKWLVLPRHHVLGSGERSSYSKALAQLSPPPFAALSAADAARLGVKEGDHIRLRADGEEYALPLQVAAELPDGLVLAGAGLPGSPALPWGGWVTIEKGG